MDRDGVDGIVGPVVERLADGNPVVLAETPRVDDVDAGLPVSRVALDRSALGVVEADNEERAVPLLDLLALAAFHGLATAEAESVVPGTHVCG